VAQVPLRAFAFAATFRLREIATLLEGAEVKQSLDELAAWWPDGSAAIAFDFGAVVLHRRANDLRIGVPPLVAGDSRAQA
jgi:hypothetical protein